LNKINTDIVIIDSGVDLNHDSLRKYNCAGISIKFDEKGNLYLVDEDYKNDLIGHGTAVFFIIKNTVPEANVFVIKLFEQEYIDETYKLIKTLEYVYNNINCKVINISFGITCCDDIPGLKNICEKLTCNGVTIVSAFDNKGIISYPAAFKNVIGVDTSILCKKIEDYKFVTNDKLNIIGMGLQQRLPWINNTYIKVAGASFVAPYFTAKVYRLKCNNVKNFDDILENLRNEAAEVIKKDSCEREEFKLFKINKAVLFPVNKEIHSIIRFNSYLNFEIQDIFDNKYLGNVGKNVSSLLNVDLNKQIKNIESLDWESDFDTFILGHVKHLYILTKKDYIRDILEKCYKNNKNIVAFDDISEYMDLIDCFKSKKLKIYYPTIFKEDLNNDLTKLRLIGKPVIGVFGTSSRQGKFTLQILLKQLFENDGYKVGFLGTEPSSLIFGANEVYPMGYEGNVNVSGEKAVKLINTLIGRIEDTDPDIIIVGSQSQTIPSDYGNIDMYPLAQHEFILGTLPDIIILCINEYDVLEYIKKTIKYLEIISDSKVIGLVLSPLSRNIQFSILDYRINILTDAEMTEKKKEIEKKLNMNVYLLNNIKEIDQLYRKCVDYFQTSTYK